MKKRDRGEYRPIFAALWDGPDFQKLSPAARLTLLALKGKTHAAGIGCLPGCSQQVSEWTGYRPSQISAALRELEKQGWLERERSVVWVVRGFEFEPTWDASNWKQRTHIQRYLETLPDLAIVRRFREKYAAWMTLPTDRLSDSPSHTPPHGNGIVDRSPSPTPTPSPEEQVRRPAKRPRGSHAEGGWPVEAAAMWTAKVGPVTPGKTGALLKPLVDLHEWPAVKAGLADYLTATPTNRANLQWFVERGTYWVDLAKQPGVDPVTGGYSERSRVVMGLAQ